MNAVTGPPPAGRDPLLASFEHWVAHRPDRVALHAPERVLTYGELAEWSGAIAARLAAAGIGAEDRVAVLAPRGADAVAGALGVLRAGAAYLPVDPAHPAERRRLVLADAGARLVVCPAASAGLVPAGHPTLTTEEALAGPVPAVRPRPVPPDCLAYVMYTSGSTGTPKGALISRASLANLATEVARDWRITPGTRCATSSPVAWDAAVLEMWVPLVAGAEIHLLPEAERTNVAAIARFARDREIGLLVLPTALGELAMTSRHLADLTGLRMLIGGDRATRRPPREAKFQVFNVYGPTEATVLTTRGPIEPEGGGVPDLGTAFAGMTVEVAGDDGEILPDGEVGELLISGPGLARGYLGRPGLTAAALVPGPGGTRRYRSGDRGRIRPDGRIEFLGRADDQVSVHGHRIELGEIIAALEGLPCVRRAVAEAFDREGAGISVVAFVVPEGTAGPEEILERLAEVLPAHALPSRVVPLEELPMLDNGKPDRARLAALRPPAPEPPAPRPASLEPAGVPERPEAQLDRLVCDLCAELLGIGRVELADDFFALGGNSLLAVRLLYEVQDAFGVRLSTLEFFAAPRAGTLSRMLGDALAAEEREGA